jgi:biopolymer transport protein TolQ
MIQSCTIWSGAPSPVGAVPAAHQRSSEDCLPTPGSALVALLVQAQAGVPPETPQTSILELVTGSYLTMGVLSILGVMSIASWGIILYKLWVFRRTRHQTAQFLDVFRRSNKFSEVQAVCRSLGESPLVGLFQSGYAELTAQLRQAAPEVSNGPNPKPAAGRPTLKSLPAVDRALLRASGVELNKLEKHIAFLATVASVAPFIGLFGTVWGIMNSFQGIGATGSTNLGVVAPGIADALLATAAGLAAAIPAVWFYNLLTQHVKLFASDMDDFSMEFLNISERNFT